MYKSKGSGLTVYETLDEILNGDIDIAVEQPSGLYRYSLGLPNQPKHKSPPNGLTDFLRGSTNRKASSQGGIVNDPAFSNYTSIFCLVH